MGVAIDATRYLKIIEAMDPIVSKGFLIRAVGLVLESVGPSARIGEICHILTGKGKVKAEVVGFRESKVLLMPFGETADISPGCEVVATGEQLSVPVGMGLLGRVLDGLGRPIDGKGPLNCEERRSIYNSPPGPLERRRISEPLSVGIKAIDGVLTCGKGQRIGIFAGSGIGKSTLLAMMARNTEADVTVIGLIGERGREVREFIEKGLGKKGLEKAVVVAATSDQPPLVRIKSALVATTIAEYFRDQGMDVLLLMDSVTRFAMAQREIGLAVGEPPTTRGYVPSVFALLPKLLERSGMAARGSITGFYTILVEADDMNDPIADSVRSILDGHIVLSRKLANKYHYPAIDVLSSVSRMMPDVVTPSHLRAAGRLKEALAAYLDAEDLINIGAYVKGSNPKIDWAIQVVDSINAFLRQDINERSSFEEASRWLIEKFGDDPT